MAMDDEEGGSERMHNHI